MRNAGFTYKRRSFCSVCHLAEWCIFRLLYWVFSFPKNYPLWTFPIVNMKVENWTSRYLHVRQELRTKVVLWHFVSSSYTLPLPRNHGSPHCSEYLDIDVCHSFIQICIRVSKTNKKEKKRQPKIVYIDVENLLLS